MVINKIKVAETLACMQANKIKHKICLIRYYPKGTNLIKKIFQVQKKSYSKLKKRISTFESFSNFFKNGCKKYQENNFLHRRKYLKFVSNTNL